MFHTLLCDFIKRYIVKLILLFTLTYLILISSLVDQTLRFFWEYIFRCTHPELFYKKDVLKNFAKLIRKHLCWCRLFNKVARWRLVALLKKGLRQRSCPENFAKFSRISILWNTCKCCFPILPNLYQPGEKFPCMWFIADSFILLCQSI